MGELREENGNYFSKLQLPSGWCLSLLELLVMCSFSIRFILYIYF